MNDQQREQYQNLINRMSDAQVDREQERLMAIQRTVMRQARSLAYRLRDARTRNDPAARRRVHDAAGVLLVTYRDATEKLEMVNERYDF